MLLKIIQDLQDLGQELERLENDARVCITGIVTDCLLTESHA
jgi:hypothetical protein